MRPPPSRDLIMVSLISRAHPRADSRRDKVFRRVMVCSVHAIRYRYACVAELFSYFWERFLAYQELCLGECRMFCQLEGQSDSQSTDPRCEHSLHHKRAALSQSMWCRPGKLGGHSPVVAIQEIFEVQYEPIAVNRPRCFIVVRKALLC